MPPRWMWPFDDELELWFEEVTRNRKKGYSSSEDDEEGSMMGNELARGRG